MDEDKKTGETRNRIVSILKEGTSFGVRREKELLK